MTENTDQIETTAEDARQRHSVHGAHQTQDNAPAEATGNSEPQPDKNTPVSQRELDIAQANNVAGLPNHVLEQVAKLRRSEEAPLRELRADIADHNLKRPSETPNGFMGEILGPAIKGRS